MNMVNTQTSKDTVALTIPTSLSVVITAEEFEELAQLNQDLRLEQTAKGVLIVNPPTGWETGKRNSRITYQLVRWLEEEGGTGEVFDSSTGFELPNGARRSPDAAWVSPTQCTQLYTQEKSGFAQLCPDFVIELRSASDSLIDLQSKMQEYLQNGTSLGWLIDPQNQRVEIYRPGEDVEVLENPENLSGETILPGFVLNLKNIL